MCEGGRVIEISLNEHLVERKVPSGVILSAEVVDYVRTSFLLLDVESDRRVRLDVKDAD